MRWLTVLPTALILAGPALGAGLDGTLKKIKSANTITLGHRESSQRTGVSRDLALLLGWEEA